MVDKGTNQGEHPLRILIAEDDRATAESLALILQMEGYFIQIASDGLAAVEAAEASHPDVVLLDIGLPRMDGYEVARKLQAQRWPRKPLLIAITGYGQQAERLLAYEAGVDMHLTKPVTPEELLYLLERFRATLKSSTS